MPPKGFKAPRTSGGPEDFAAVTTDLNRDENDAQNVGYHATVLEAWQIVLGHPMLEQIVQEDPPPIQAGGAIAPFT